MGAARQKINRARARRGAALMGILNVTPDSFSDGGEFLSPDAARHHIDGLVSAGAEILDVGGESTRPGAETVPRAQQLERIEPSIRYAVAHTDCIVSIDTTDPGVADSALRWGAHLVNDTSCLANVELAEVAARHGAGLVIMHSRGLMRDMHAFSEWPDDAYDDIVSDVARDWSVARDHAVNAGVDREELYFDPGLGFAKNARQSLELLARLSEFSALGHPVVVGPSRKSFIAQCTDGADAAFRLGGTVAACLESVRAGANVVRVHDVQPVAQALLLMTALNSENRHGKEPS